MIHVSSCVFLGNEIRYVNDCLTTTQLTQGKYVERLESEWAKFSGAKYAIACSSGTAALHLALLALDLQCQNVADEVNVAVPALTYIATANAVTYCGHRPVFIDVDIDTWCMHPQSVPNYCECAIPVHLYGCVEKGWGESYVGSCKVIEDSAQAHGSHLQGDLAIYSFYASKVIAAGEGGMVTTNDKSLSDKCRLYRGQGICAYAITHAHYWHDVIGYNYRMTEISAAIALAQLETWGEHARRRRVLYQAYSDGLGDMVTIFLRGASATGNWVMPVLLPDGIDVQSIRVALMADEIETRPFFMPIPMQPPYKSSIYQGSYPVSTDLFNRGLCLPLHSGLTTDDVEIVCDALNAAISSSKSVAV